MTLDTVLHSLTLTGVFAVLTILLREHKVWVRMKDRINTLWHRHCKETGDAFVPLDNGRRG